MATLWCEALTVKIVWHCFSRSGMGIKIVPQSLDDILGGLSNKLDIRWAPIKGWQVPEVLAAQIWVLLHLRTECASHPLFSQVNPCLQTLDLTCSTLFIVTALWHFFALGKAAGIILHLESWFAAGTHCKNRWKESPSPQIANFCPSPNPFSPHSETHDLPAFCHFQERMQS